MEAERFCDMSALSGAWPVLVGRPRKGAAASGVVNED